MKLTGANDHPQFQSFLMGGFECAAHIRKDGRRLDLLASTRHDIFTRTDYQFLQTAGIRTVRDGLRWHRIEASPARYDWSSFIPMVRAAFESGMEVIWDLCHWGVPDWLDPFSSEFPEVFARFAAAAAVVMAQERDALGIVGPVYLSPINEISFWAWAGGDVAYLSPLARGRGPALKKQLVRATILAICAVRKVLVQARFLQPEPVIHITPATRRESTVAKVHAYNAAVFEAWDMLAGRLEPDLGGSEDLLDIIGVNYYWNNQWIHQGERTPLGHPAHTPLHVLLVEVWERYQRPIVLSETGAEGSAALGWIGMIGAEARRARALGCQLCGICTYPICDYPGWDDNRHVQAGLLALDRHYRQRSLRFELGRELHSQCQLWYDEEADWQPDAK